MKEYETKDSGKRVHFASGMNRDVGTGKPRYDLCYEPLLTEWAHLMARGAEKYGENNWQLADSEEELTRFKASAFRHFMQFMNGEDDEAHHAATIFNVAAIMHVRRKLDETKH